MQAPHAWREDGTHDLAVRPRRRKPLHGMMMVVHGCVGTKSGGHLHWAADCLVDGSTNTGLQLVQCARRTQIIPKRILQLTNGSS